MIFLGITFLSGKNSLYPPPNKVEIISSVSISNGSHNQLFISKNPNKTVNNWDDDWDYDTVMDAEYNENLDAGNSGFSLRNTDNVIIRRRELLDDNWVTIYVKEINTSEDFDINFLDRYARLGDTEYVYRISSTLNGIENSYVEQNVVSSSDGMYLSDKDSTYGTMYNLDGCDTTQNFKSNIIETYNRYPTVVSNSIANYEKGSASGLFLVMDENCELNRQNTLKYRNLFKERLASRKSFILKVPDGRIWMAKCIGSPTDTMDGHKDLRMVTFEWVEIGSVNDMEALYYNGLSDVSARWWY